MDSFLSVINAQLGTSYTEEDANSPAKLDIIRQLFYAKLETLKREIIDKLRECVQITPTPQHLKAELQQLIIQFFKIVDDFRIANLMLQMLELRLKLEDVRANQNPSSRIH
jgi:hypothetical protein